MALEAARRIGDRVIGIVAIDTLQTVGQPPVSEREVQMRLKPFRENFIGHTRDFVSHNFFTKDADPAFIRKVADDMSLAPPEVAIPSMERSCAWITRHCSRISMFPSLRSMPAPGGAVDEARTRKSLPTFHAISIPDTGHFLMLEAPQRFNPVLLRELASIAHAH